MNSVFRIDGEWVGERRKSKISYSSGWYRIEIAPSSSSLSSYTWWFNNGQLQKQYYKSVQLSIGASFVPRWWPVELHDCETLMPAGGGAVIHLLSCTSINQDNRTDVADTEEISFVMWYVRLDRATRTRTRPVRLHNTNCPEESSWPPWLGNPSPDAAKTVLQELSVEKWTREQFSVRQEQEKANHLSSFAKRYELSKPWTRESDAESDLEIPNHHQAKGYKMFGHPFESRGRLLNHSKGTAPIRQWNGIIYWSLLFENKSTLTDWPSLFSSLSDDQQ